MVEVGRKHFGHRALALLLAALLLVQAAPAAQVRADAFAAETTEETLQMQELTEALQPSDQQLWQTEPEQPEIQEPEQPADEPAAEIPNLPFSAKIGEKELEIVEGDQEHCDKMYADVPVYILLIPEGETASTFTLTAPGCAYVKGGGCTDRTWDITDPVELDILEGKTYHIRKGWDQTFHIGFRRGEEGPIPPKVPEITANIGDRTLDVAEQTVGNFPCGAVHSYEIKVPETLKDQPVSIGGLADYAYRPITGDTACDGAVQNWSGSAAMNEYGYHFVTEQNYAVEYQNLHVTFTVVKEEAPKAPFQVTLGNQELTVDLLPPTSEYGPKGAVVHVPSPFAKTVTFHNVKGWTYMKKNQETGQMFSIDTDAWETEILGPDDFFILSNWPDRYRVTFETAEAAEANFVVNAQMDGKFLLPPETKAAVAPGLAKEAGFSYGDGVTERDVTLLDVLVKMHQLKYPDEQVTKYLTVDPNGTITKAFGTEDPSAAFLVNGKTVGTPIHSTCIGDGDTVDFFNHQSPAPNEDKIVWLEQNGVKKTHFDAAPGTPLTLTVRCADEKGDPAAVAGVQVAVVAQDGSITPLTGTTDENGEIRITFAQTGEQTITVVSSGETKVVMPVAHVTVAEHAVTLSVEARTAGKGDFLPATVFAVEADSQKTVKEILDEAAKHFGLDVVYTDNGGLDAINGLKGVDGGWRYYVNEEDGTESIAQRKVSAGDKIRVRYAVTAAADELKAPLYQYLKTRVAEAKDKLTLAYTQQTKDVLQAAVTAADAVLQDPANNSTDTDKELLVSKHIAAVDAGIAQLVPEETAVDPAIPQDFENDLWLQYDYKAMAVGETATIYPRRIPQIIDNPITNSVTRPVFRFEVVKGDSVTLSEAATREKTTVNAVKEGTSVVKVTYDAEGDYGACSPVNEGYVVFQVGGSGSVQISTSLSQIRSYDTVYYAGTDTVAYPFTVSAPGAAKVDVICNDHIVEPNDDGSYTATLENRSNVIGITAVDAQGRTSTYYQTVDARKIQVVVDNKTSPGKPFKINDTARISFRGITMPVAKLATIYNPCFGEENPRTYVYYQNAQLGELRGYCNQYDLATKNSFEVTFTEAGDYAFTGGRIHCAWWGDELGSDKHKEGTGKPNMGAPIVQDNFSWMPDFTIHVSNEISDHVPVTGIELNRKELTLKEGESFQLTAKVLPANATNQKITWSCDDPTGFFVTLDKESGKITANNATTDEKPVITVTATTDDGRKTASCAVTVQPVLHTVSVENGTADPDRAARKTVVSIQAEQAPEGQQFDHWEVTDGTITLKDRNQPQTTFVMPDSDVALKAVFVPVKEPDRKPGGSTHSYSPDAAQDGKGKSNTTDAEVVDGIVNAKALAAIKGKDQNLRITGKLEDGREFVWTINGKDLKKAVDLKVGMSRKGQYAADIEKLAEDAEIFCFLETGEFPAPMQVEFPTDLADGSYLLMRYDPAGRNAEKISKVEVKDGMVKFIAQQGGEYFLAKRVSGKSVTELEAEQAVQQPNSQTEPTAAEQPTQAPVQQEKGGSGNALAAGGAVIGIVIAAGCVWFVLRKRKEN